MSVVVFCGPTISAAEVREWIDAVCLPPAGYGDVIRAVEMSPRPRVIAIIDGAFRNVPAVRHKEILWALSQGVHVFGAASMGALRAAELCDYGMVGIGSIFSDYRSGRTEDDDDVAVEHGPPELGFLSLSESMVDIRATLDAAVLNGVIGGHMKSCLLNQAKQKFYAERHWPRLLEHARTLDFDATMVDALEAWLPAGRVHRKRDDALEMLGAICDFIATDPSPFDPNFTFERTDVWDLDYEAAHSLPQSIEGENDALRVEDILDELRLSPDDYRLVQQEALVRALSIREARRHGMEPEPEEKERVLREWLRERGIGVQRALDEDRLGEADLEAFVRDEALVRWTAEKFETAIHDNLFDALRARGRLAPLIKRAEVKRDALRSMGKEGATTQTSGQSPAALLGWFWRRTFPGQMQMMPPEILAQNMGFSDVSAMNRALLREYLFSEYERGKRTASHRVD
ncbi:MAG: TfuA-like protein [Microvirga sp.]